jgi:hypothetical protein
MNLSLHHVAVMSITEFGKRGEGVRYHFLKIGTDAVQIFMGDVKQLKIFNLVWKNYEYKFQNIKHCLLCCSIFQTD